MASDVSGLAVGLVPEEGEVTPEAEVGVVITEDLGKLKTCHRWTIKIGACGKSVAGGVYVIHYMLEIKCWSLNLSDEILDTQGGNNHKKDSHTIVKRTNMNINFIKLFLIL